MSPARTTPSASVGTARLATLALAALALAFAGCSAKHYREEMDEAASAIITEKQLAAVGHEEPFTTETPEDALRRRLLIGQKLPYSGPASLGTRDLPPVPHWPEPAPPVATGTDADPITDRTFPISLPDALQIAAQNNRGYQDAKRDVYSSALRLELERDDFRTTLAGFAEGTALLDRSRAGTPGGVVSGIGSTSAASASQLLKNGTSLAARIGIDLARMLQPDRQFSSALSGDASITIPLLRGSGRYIVTEPLTQAERDTVYAIWTFERFKQQLVVSVLDSYLGVLASLDQVDNQADNYRSLISSTRRAQRLADAGKLPQVQVDQSIQNELRARDRWVVAQESAARQEDQLKILMGLPPDARVKFDPGELTSLQDRVRTRLKAVFSTAEPDRIVDADAPIVLQPVPREQAGPYELPEALALRLALDHRVDLLVREGEVVDAQRKVVVAADRLRAEVTLLGTASTGERRSIQGAGAPSSTGINFSRGIYTGILSIDLALERTAEAVAYRESLLALDARVRAAQELEDQVKFQVRDNLRNLETARSSLVIQVQAVRLAERRVRGTQLELDAGRVEIRDLLDAQESLVTAQNALTTAMVSYRVSEVEMQRDLGLLEVDASGLWQDLDVKELQAADSNGAMQ